MGQGPVFLQALALLKGFDIAAVDPLGDPFVHTVAEALKLALADREAFYGDPLHSEVPLETLLSDAYNDARRALIGTTASQDLRPGALLGARGRTDAMLARAGSETPVGAGFGEPTFMDLPEVEGDTFHLDVIDRFGNVVSATPSGGWLQSSPVAPELGFPITTRAQMMWLAPGLPSSLAPGRRPRTTLTPTLVGRGGEPWLAFGTPGGDQQDQWNLTVFLRHLHHGMGLQAAIDAPQFHTRHVPASLYPRAVGPSTLVAERRFPSGTIAALTARGHRVAVEADWSLGRVCAAARNGAVLMAASTPRFTQGYAVGR